MKLLIALLMGWILCGIEMDMLVPSLPELQNIYGLSTFAVEWTIGVSCIAHFITALSMGVLADKFGYRPMILTGAIAFVIGGIICLTSNSFPMLLTGRALQGIGNASTTTISYLVLTNIYSMNKQQEILGFLNGVIVSSMTIAPVIGSYLALFFGWRGGVALIFLLSILNMILCYLFVPYHKPHGSDTICLGEYKKVFKSKKILYYVLAVGFAASPYFIFASLAPILYIDSYGISLQHFGLYQGSLCLVFAIFSFSNGLIIKKFGTKKPVYFSLICYILYIIYTTYILVANINDPIIITSSMLILSAAVAVPYNILYPLMFEILPESKGKTSALLTTVKMLALAMGVEFASYFYDHSFLMIGISITIIVLATLFFTLKLLFTENEISKLY